MYVYDKEGRRTEATAKDAAEMVKCGDFSALSPKGSKEAEAAALKAGVEEDARKAEEQKVRDAEEEAVQKAAAPVVEKKIPTRGAGR